MVKKSARTAAGNELPAGLASPAQRALAAAGIRNLDELSRHTEADISRMHGIGPNALRQLRLALAANGLSFRNPK